MNRALCFAWFLLASLFLASAAKAQDRQLWLYHSTNLQVPANVDKLQPIWKRGAAAGYTHVLLADAKLAKLDDLGEMTRTYFRNLERTKQIAADLKLEIVPALFHIGYSNNMLWHDPNLAEGLPVKDQKFVVNNNQATPVADPPISFPTKPAFKDEAVKLEDGLATLRDFSGNARLSYKLAVAPFRCYHVSVKVKTQDFTGKPEIKALAGPRSLQWEDLRTKKTQDWTEHHVVFNSLDNSTVNVYFGVWGGGKGTLQWKDWKIEEAGLVNVLRRDGAPFTVKGYVEGKGYEKVVDPRLGQKQWKGQYDSWHEPVTIKTKGIPDGTELRVSWHHPAIIYDHQVACCPADPRTLALMRTEFEQIKRAISPKGFMMSHDEVRTLGWDHSCMKTGKDSARILADNARAALGILEAHDVYAWNDMFDPHHNAVEKDYYLVRGSLRGSWEGLDPKVTIMNWNFSKRDASLKFFADRGHRQIIAGYYDHDPRQITQWLDSARNIKGVVGAMYTTWKNQYDDLERFAELVKQHPALLERSSVGAASAAVQTARTAAEAGPTRSTSAEQQHP